MIGRRWSRRTGRLARSGYATVVAILVGACYPRDRTPRPRADQPRRRKAEPAVGGLLDQAVGQQRVQAADALDGVVPRRRPAPRRRPVVRGPQDVEQPARAPAGRCRRTSAPAAAARRAAGSRPAARRSGRAPGRRRSAACPATQTSAPSSIAATENRTARSGSAGASAAMSARSAARAVAGLRPPVHQPGHHPPHVGVHHRLRPPVPEAGDRPGGVRADPGQRLQRGDVVGHHAAVPLDDRHRRLAQPQRPAGVAELAPGADRPRPGLTAASAAGVGQRAIHSRQTGSTRATGVCWSITSLTSTAHASMPGRRHGQVPRGAGVPVDDRLAGVRARRGRGPPAASCSREPSLPSRRSGVPGRPGRSAASYRSPACCTRSARCRPPSTGGGGCWCSSVLLAVLGGGGWLASRPLIGGPAADGDGTPSAAAGAAGAHARAGAGPAVVCARRPTPPTPRGDRSGPPRPRPPAQPTGPPGRRRTVHRRHDQPRRPHAAASAGVGEQADVRDRGHQHVRRCPASAPWTRACRRSCCSTAGQPDLGEQRLLPGGQQRPAHARAGRGGPAPGALGRADQRADLHAPRGRRPARAATCCAGRLDTKLRRDARRSRWADRSAVAVEDRGLGQPGQPLADAAGPGLADALDGQQVLDRGRQQLLQPAEVVDQPVDDPGPWLEVSRIQ